MINTVNEYTDEQGKSPYADWLASLRDARAKAQIIMQVDRMELDLFGDSEPIGEGLSELKIPMALVIGFTMAKRHSRFIYCYVAVINPHNPRTSNAPRLIGKITSRGMNMARNVKITHSEHLRNPEVAAEYLNSALEDGEPSVILMALRNIAEAQEGGIAGLAARAHLGRESMYKMLSDTGNPKLSSFTKVIEGLGLHLKIEARP